MIKYEEQINELKSLGKYIMRKDMTWGNAGNISIRISEESCLITVSGTHLDELRDNDFVLYNITKNKKKGKFSPNKKPSKELGMHSAIYEKRSDINVIIHVSPFYSTLLGISNFKIPNNLFVEAMYYLERIVRVPYFHPGSNDLAEGVRQNCRKTNIILLENHGVVVYDKSVKEAKTALVTLENACKMLILAKSADIDIKVLDSNIVDDFLYNSGYKSKRWWDN